ncbi:hypothetical protein [Streptomyces genisteinicus]|uniref:Secreted protein n=1 Tax=Streptomyces genisteinicus TaxID=2768068 RepID=A0A7H0HPJ6_9ACTN|nr:hypothetical protein [Streptomyces genisteinicus]QNP62462.1 hypothetical protein IAG43_05600 [Streptomyces genisteinicus]
MQNPVVPDLAHTQTRPVHWLLTATAMAAVVAGAGLLQPDAATATQSGTAARAGAAAPVPAPEQPAPAPDPAAVELPLECGGLPALVTAKATGDLDGDGGPETVVAARCDAGSGNPPHGVYVLAAGRDGTARIVATLVDPEEKASVADLAVRDGAVTAALLGYSSLDVPRCCPDIREQVKWQWRGGVFVRSDDTAALGV